MIRKPLFRTGDTVHVDNISTGRYYDNIYDSAHVDVNDHMCNCCDEYQIVAGIRTIRGRHEMRTVYELLYTDCVWTDEMFVEGNRIAHYLCNNTL